MEVKRMSESALDDLPSAQPEKRTEERTKTHACDLISRQAAIDGKTSVQRTNEVEIYSDDVVSVKYLENLPSAQPEPCEDVVPRTSVEYICRKNTVSTNPYEHKYHDKFIQFMDDPEISDFGRWQHSNGFNTALVAVKCDLDKVPSVAPERKKGKWERPFEAQASDELGR